MTYSTAYNGGLNQQGPQFAEWYSYHQAGARTAKRLQVTAGRTVNVDASYMYDTEGRMKQVTYPATVDSQGVSHAGPVYNYGFDSMGRLSGLTDQYSTSWVNGLVYGPANELKAMSYFGAYESRGYDDSRLQLTSLNGITYTYPSGGHNIGKIVSQAESGGDTVTYAYDSLNRLISATSNGGWADSYAYDAFGNLDG